MPRRRDNARVLGPSQHPKGWKVTTVDPRANGGTGKRSYRYLGSLEEAQDWKRVVEARLARLESRTITNAIDSYSQHQQEQGNEDVSHVEVTRRLRLFFPNPDMLLGQVTAERARGYYDAFRQRLRHDGQPISVAYHRAALINARSLFTWCIGEGWLHANPFAAVKGVGRRNSGKVQHTGDEVRKLYAHCIARAEAGDRGALGVLMALLMALRSSDVTRRIVRDVDLDGTVLRVWDGKSKKSNRPRKIPAVLQPMLRELAAGRPAFEPLFKTPYTESGHHTRRWLEQVMEKLCEAAGVPYVCPHALKGTAGTLMAETGAAADVIADHLSHEKTSTTTRHYVAPGALEQGQAERAFRVIAGGSK